MQLTDAQRLDWLRLIRTEGIGPRTFRKLVNRFGGAGAALQALPDLTRRAGKRVVPPSLPEIEREVAAAARLGVAFVAMGEDAYPKSLQATDAAPPLIAVRGDPAILTRPALAICRLAQRLGRRGDAHRAARTGAGDGWASRRVGPCPRHRRGR